jgi:phage shock protein A
MSLLQRASKLMKANINHLMDNAEDPEVMIKQLIREMDESVVELRRETVNAVARQKQLEKKKVAAKRLADELQGKAVLALDHGDEPLTRRLLSEKVEALKSWEALGEELKSATTLATRLKAELSRMQEQADLARRKKDELIRRKRAAEAQLRTQEAARRSAEAVSAAAGRVGQQADGAEFAGYADEIGTLEAQAEAARELSDAEDDGQARLGELVRASEIDEELERLKAERAASK